MSEIVSEKESRLYAWYVLVAMVVLYMLNVTDRYVASGLLERIKESFEVSDTYMGFLIGPAFAFFYTILAIPIAVLADQYNRIRIICIGAVLWSFFTVLSGLAETPTVFALSRIGVGVGEAAFLAPAFSLLSDYFPPRRRALAFAILNFGVYLGQLTGMVGGAAIADALDWRWAFILLGAPGIFVAAIAYITVKEPARGRMDTGGMIAADADVWGALKKSVPSLMACKSYMYMVFGTICGGFAGYGFGIWAPTLFVRSFGLDLTEANSRYGFPSVVAGILGAVILGYLSDRLSAKNPQWPLVLSGYGLVASGFFMMGISFAPSPEMATLLAIPAGLLGGGWVIGVQASLQDLLPSKMRATATSLWAFSLTFSGLALGVQFAGFSIDYLETIARSGQGDLAILLNETIQHPIRLALFTVLLPVVPGCFFLIKASRTISQDREFLLDKTA